MNHRLAFRAVAASLCLPRRSGAKAGRGVLGTATERRCYSEINRAQILFRRWTFGTPPSGLNSLDDPAIYC